MFHHHGRLGLVRLYLRQLMVKVKALTQTAATGETKRPGRRGAAAFPRSGTGAPPPCCFPPPHGRAFGVPVRCLWSRSIVLRTVAKQPPLYYFVAPAPYQLYPGPLLRLYFRL